MVTLKRDTPSPLSDAEKAEKQELAALRLKTLGDPMRMRLVRILLSHKAGSLDVQDLERLCEGSLNQSSISQHLKKLQECGLLTLHHAKRCYHYYAVSLPALVEMQGSLQDLLDLQPKGGK